MSTPERRAYRDAWRVREQTGDTSQELLLDKLRAHEAGPVWSDGTADLHKWLMSCWERGVSPGALTVEAAKQMVKLVPRIVKPFRDLVRYIR